MTNPELNHPAAQQYEPLLPPPPPLEVVSVESVQLEQVEPQPPVPAPIIATAPPSSTLAPALASERVVVAAPLSFAGSAARIWRPLVTRVEGNLLWVTVPAAVLLITIAWSFVLCWYATFGLLVVPYRLIRRSQRTHKRDSLQHRELLGALEQQQQQR
jgi:hypothetical protein